ncbi:MAG: radical SAM protein, partial [Anaerolineae bacterium]
GFTLAFGPYSPAGPVVLNRPALERLRAFRAPQPPEEAVDFTLAAQNLLLPVDGNPPLEWGRPAILTAWLHITNACNLACPYCYVRKSSARMSDDTGRRVVDAIFRSAQQNGFRVVKLKYAGGEAALHVSLVQRLHRYAEKQAAQTGLNLQAVILSNGTRWTPAMAQWLVESGVRLVISLDGVGATHDALRPTVSGGGSFAQIERTVDRVLLPAGARPDIAITVSGRNAHAAAGAVAWAIERDLPFSLNFYRQNPLSASRADLNLEEGRIIAGMLRAYCVVEERLPARPFLNGLLDRAQMEAHTHTCSVGQSYLVFSHTGQANQCQMDLTAGNPIEGTDDVLALAAQGDIPVISVDEKAGCSDCVWRYRCAGGCPLETFRATGRWDAQSPHCNIYRTLFPAALRLEGLRLLKAEGLLP